MAWTSATLKQAIQDYLQTTEDTFVDNLDAMIQQGEDRISKRIILPMNRKTATITFVNGTQTAALPDDFLAPFELRSVVSGSYYPVGYYDVSYILEAFPDPTVTGRPTYYSMYTDSTIILGPTPNASSQGFMHYFYKPASITVGGTSWLGTNAESCLLYASLIEAYTFLKGEGDLMKLYEEKFQSALGDLRVLGEGLDLGDAYRMGERRTSR